MKLFLPLLLTMFAVAYCAGSPQADFPLPNEGASIRTTVVAEETELNIQGSSIKNVEFRGEFIQRVDRNPDDTKGRLLQTTAFRVTGVLPDGRPITIQQNDTVKDQESTLGATKTYPPSTQERDIISITMTIDRGDGGGGQEVLTSKVPMILVSSSLTHYPPANTKYQLESPVDLVASGNPDVTVVTLSKFVATRNQE
ncbi:hypothetical protein BGX28_002078 [Mortierella sp. GBA30]|nr:hypothetical protein BGX28_002078 [Mortierella sp. GBA30]